MFVGRARELARLGQELAAPRPSLVVVYGRRRVGKSALLREAVKDRPHVFFQAARVAPALNLASLKAEASRAFGPDAVLDGLGGIEAVLAWLAAKARSVPGLTVVLDEFPYLTDTDASLPSVIQRFWDGTAAAEGRLNLVLCGSLIAQMEDLLAERNPLYGRKTMAMEVTPLPLRDAVRFFPSYTAEEKLQAYGVFGGVPFYLRLCDPAEPLRQNVLDLLLSPAGALADEPTVLLQSELRDVQRYASILSAIADGCTKLGEIASRIGESETARLTPYLHRLHRMHLTEAILSLDASPKSRDRRYGVTDPLVAFWHRFVRPNLSSIAEGFGEDVWRLRIAPRLDEFMGGRFEAICREHARSYAQERMSAPAREVGRIWTGDYDIDVAGRLLDDAALFGECTWQRDPVGTDVAVRLVERADSIQYGRGAPDRFFALYARGGFKDSVLALRDRFILYTPSTMLEP